MSAVVHDSPFAGSWYPGNPEELRELLDELFARSESRTAGPLQDGATGFVVPHAGLAYSGCVAASVYRHLERKRPRRVVVLGIVHRGAPGGAWIPEVDSFRTPLGSIEVDREACRELLGAGGTRSLPEDRLCDHSIEIQLPLLQRAAPDAQVVPVYVSAMEAEGRRRLATAISGLVDQSTVILASSDFTHYGRSFGYQPFPLDAHTPFRLKELDEGVIDAAGSIDSRLLLQCLTDQPATVCGKRPIALLLEVLSALPDGQDYFQRTLDYETSGDTTGDFSHCVSYAALAYYPWGAFLLGEEDGRALRQSARDTLRQYQETGRPEAVPPAQVSGALKRSAGAFVTLERDGRLRGCVGRVLATEPLAEIVPRMTLAAALEDSRFDPVQPDESGLDVEISVLSPMKRLFEASSFRVGRDGGYLKAGGLSGLLLPQVAEGRNWDASDFLEALARKTRADASVYSDPDSRLYVFRAQLIK